jgi:serine phosphatase RsbU (regulator of sigma subunit)
MLPFGILFGLVTSRGLVKRINRLVDATTRFANGDYSQRVSFSRPDEIGQLENQFNQMAEQLVESIAREKATSEQSARREERARIEQELRTAQYIQRSLLPEKVPSLEGWMFQPYYQPAREVGGDFYDFLALPDGQIGIVIADVTGKGIAAALVMATTCTMLRATTSRITSPGEVLARVNNLVHDHIPAGMFVTCFYAVLQPTTGRLRFSNAGHDIPYRLEHGDVCEVRAVGMPLGLMPDEQYEEKEIIVREGESILFYTDGLVEAHNPEREMYGFPRLKTMMQDGKGSKVMIESLLDDLQRFTGKGWEQEDDVTLVTLQRV